MIVVKVGYGRKRLEEHLLICSACRDRLESTDEYLAAMRSAANRGAAGGVAVAGGCCALPGADDRFGADLRAIAATF